MPAQAGIKNSKQAGLYCERTGCLTTREETWALALRWQPLAAAWGRAVRKVLKHVVGCSGLLPCCHCMTAAALTLTWEAGSIRVFIWGAASVTLVRLHRRTRRPLAMGSPSGPRNW